MGSQGSNDLPKLVHYKCASSHELTLSLVTEELTLQADVQVESIRVTIYVMGWRPCKILNAFFSPVKDTFNHDHYIVLT